MERYYNSKTGRYDQSDRIGLRGGINTYAYVGNNPVNMVDPDGRLAQVLIPGAAAGAGVAAIICATNPQLCKKVVQGCVDAINRMFNEASDNSDGGESSAGSESPYGSTPEGKPFTKHYGTETGPERNIPGSVVDDVVNNTQGVDAGGGKTAYYDPTNNVTVVTGDGGSIVSAHKGPPRSGQR